MEESLVIAPVKKSRVKTKNRVKTIAGDQYFKLFEKFIAETGRGNRLKKDGKKIRQKTVDTYIYVLKLLREFSVEKDHELKLFFTYKVNQTENEKIKKYYKKFYKEFTDFLYNEKDYYDNYVGLVIKSLRAFFNYLKGELNHPVGSYHQSFYSFSEDIPIVTLTPEQLNYLIYDKEFNNKLPEHLVKYKDIFVFGCTVALRQSDLSALKRENLHVYNNNTYLKVISKKTDTPTSVRLPDYCVEIIEKYRSRSKFLLPQITNARMNICFKQLGQFLEMKEPMIKYRCKRGERFAVYKDKKNRVHYTLADHLTTHTMRRTAITTMLRMGMNEHAVRKISGHAPNSKEFFRYVELAQSFMDEQTSMVHQKIAELAPPRLN